MTAARKHHGEPLYKLLKKGGMALMVANPGEAREHVSTVYVCTLGRKYVTVAHSKDGRGEKIKFDRENGYGEFNHYLFTRETFEEFHRRNTAMQTIHKYSHLLDTLPTETLVSVAEQLKGTKK